jgi:hypothetical protein
MYIRKKLKRKKGDSYTSPPSCPLRASGSSRQQLGLSSLTSPPSRRRGVIIEKSNFACMLMNNLEKCLN